MRRSVMCMLKCECDGCGVWTRSEVVAKKEGMGNDFALLLRLKPEPTYSRARRRRLPRLVAMALYTTN